MTTKIKLYEFRYYSCRCKICLSVSCTVKVANDKAGGEKMYYDVPGWCG